jgi:hypothetical protein
LSAQDLIAPDSGAQSSQPSAEMRPVAVVAVAPYQKLLSDIALLGQMMGRPEASQMVEGGFTFLTQGKGPDALDKTQPWGIIVQTDGAAIEPVGCLPLTKPEDALAVAAAYGVQVKDAPNGVKELVLSKQRTAYYKQQGGWAFVSLSPAALSRLPEDPRAILSELVTEYDVAARIVMKDVPEMYRQFAIQALQAGMQQRIDRRDGETDEQYALRQKLAETQMAETARTLNETDSITIGWAIDGRQQRTHVDYTQTFAPDSKMARQLAGYERPETNFAGFYQPDAAATLTVATKADPSAIRQDIESFTATLEALRAGLSNKIDASDAKNPEALKAAMNDIFDALEATMRGGRIDAGGALDMSADSLTLVAAAHVIDTAKIESGLKKLETAAAESPEFPGIRWNAASHAGVRFHVLTLPVPEEHEAPRQLLGNQVSIAIGVGSESVYLAIGENGLDAMREAIDASAAEPNKAVPPFELTLSLAKIMETAAAQAEPGKHQAMCQLIAEQLRTQAQGRDHIRAVGQVVPNGLRYRVSAEEGVLKAIGAAATEAQRQALQASQ